MGRAPRLQVTPENSERKMIGSINPYRFVIEQSVLGQNLAREVEL